MSQICTICSSSRRAAVEDALASGLSVRKTAAQFSFSRSAVDRHHRHCSSLEAEKVSPGTSQASLRRLCGALERVLRKAERKGDHRASLECITRMAELQKQLVASEKPARQVQIRIVESQARIKNPSALFQFKRTLQRLIESTGGSDGLSEAVGIASARLLMLIDKSFDKPEIRAALEAAGAGCR